MMNSSFQETLETAGLRSLSHSGKQVIYTACLGTEGNGPNFSVHLGAYIALLEHNILPTTAIGGSSGAVTVSLLMALLENQSLDQGEIGFTRPQKASLVLAACSCVLESFTFFPTLTQFKKTLWNWVRNFFTHYYCDRLLAEANVEVIHVENMVGQVAVAVDFFRSTDFSSVILEEDYLLRCQIMKQLWLKHTDAIEVTTWGLLSALSRYRTKDCSEQDKIVAERFVQLLHRDSLQEVPPIIINAVRRLKTFMIRIYSLIERRRPRSQAGLLRQILERKIALFNPDYVWLGYRGFSQTGAFLSIPKGTVIHSAFRRASDCKTKEYSGWLNLYQAYFPAANILPHFLMARSQESTLISMLSNSIKNSESRYMISPDRILILPELCDRTQRGFSYALQASISEAGYFRRYPLPLTKYDYRLNPAMPQTLLPFGGGWLEKTPVASIRQLPICQDVDFCITLCRRDNVSWFSRLAFRTVLGDRYDREFPRIAKLMNRFVNYATSLSGRKGNIHAVFDKEWNNPVMQGHENFFLKDLKVALLPDRQAHMLVGYLEIVKILHSQGYVTPNSTLLPWGKPIPQSLIQAGRTASRTAHEAFWMFVASIRTQ